MLNKIFNKNNRANCASTSTTATTAQIADNTTVVSNDTTNTSIDFFDASCLFDMKQEYKQMVQKVFSSMIRRLFIEGIPAKPGEFCEVRNANCYAYVAGKPLDTRKLMDVVGYFGYDPELIDFDFWQKIVSKDWKNDDFFHDFKVVLRHWSHNSGDTGVYDCTISYYHASITISTRTGWSLKFMQRLVHVAGLFIISKLNRSEEFEAYATKNGNRFTSDGTEYRNFGAMKSNSTTAMRTSTHEYVLNGTPDNISIVTREKARFTWQRPDACSIAPMSQEEAERYNQYFFVHLNPNTAAINSYHRGTEIY